MSLLYRRDADVSEFVREAQRFLSAIGRGYPLDTAARRARTTPEQIRVWLREPAFAAAFRRARDGGPRVRLIRLDQIGASEDPQAELDRLIRRRDAGQASDDDLRRLGELKRATKERR